MHFLFSRGKKQIFNDIFRRAAGWRLAAGGWRPTTDRRSTMACPACPPPAPNRRRPYPSVGLFLTIQWAEPMGDNKVHDNLARRTIKISLDLNILY